MTRRMMMGALLLLTLLAGLIPGAAEAQPVQWPTLKAQLSKDKVIPGSALEELIRENQDFRLLRKDELNDKIRVPLWLRVAWRKSHPEQVYSADDPTGGYPLFLKEVHEWMLHHQDLKPGPRERDIAPWEKLLVGPNIRISGAQTTRRSESDIRVNYWDPAKIISGSNNIGGSGRQAQYFSTDGGGTWGQTTLTLTGPDVFHSDPTVDWTSNGTAWTTTLGIVTVSPFVGRLRVYTSGDDGATWAFHSTASGNQTAVDKQMVWVDHSPTSPFQDRVYAIWHNNLPAFMNRFANGAWLANPTQVSGAESTGTAIGGDVKTNANGDVFGFWPTTGNRKIFVVKSTNGGDNFGAPVQVATTFDGFDIGVPAFNGRRALIYVSAGAYRTATKDLVYATWTDLTGGMGCSSAANEPGSNVNSACKTRIWFSRSTDGGASWSSPVKINDQASLNDQFNQWMVVDEANGALAVIYYDTVADAGRKKTHVYYQASFDDGVTWTAPAQVTTAETDETVAGADLNNQYGDYNSLSGIARTLFPSWTDRRNNSREEIWTAALNEPATNVWSKDKPWDTGLEPDPATAANNMWESDDIWVRPDQLPGPHENPEFGQVNNVHVLVRNKSNVDGLNVPVKLYYAHASTGLAWDVDWTLIGTVVLPNVPANSNNTEAVFQWSPPGTGHYCLLARIDTAQDPMTNAEGVDVNYNTRFNNNIAWKNVNVVNLKIAKQVKVNFIFRNDSRREREVRLVFREPKEQLARNPFFKRGGVVVDLGEALVKEMEEQGVREQGFERIDRTARRIVDPERAEIVLPSMKGREEHTLTMIFEDFNPGRESEKTVTYLFEVVQMEGEKEVTGGITYTIQANPF